MTLAMTFVILPLPGMALLIGLCNIPQEDKTWSEALATFQKLSRSKEAADRAQAVELLAKATNEKHDKACWQHSIAHLRQELNRDVQQGRNEERVSGSVLEACVATFRKIRHKDVVAEMVRVAKSPTEPPRVRLHVVWGLSGTAGVQELTELAEERTPQVQVAAIDALADRGDVVVRDFLLSILKDRKRPWEARIGAVRGLEKGGGEGGVEALLEGLAAVNAEGGRLKDEVVLSLRNLSALDYDTDDAAFWKGAWAAKKKGEDPPPAAKAPAPEEPIEFLGIQARSKRVIFVLDRSSVMSTPFIGAGQPARMFPPMDPDAAPAGRKETAQERDARAEAERIRRKHDGRVARTLLEALKKDFINAVWNLGEDVSFGVVWYDTTAHPWKDRCVAATWPNKLDIIKEVDRVQPSGGSSIWAGLEHALKMVESEIRPDILQADRRINYTTLLGGADTVFLMTGGVHFQGKFVNDTGPNVSNACDRDGFVSEIRKLGRLRRIRIHTAAMGSIIISRTLQRPDTDLMKRVAEETGGQFTHIQG